ncbi:MAG: hypothetical protein WC480_04350 [Patescibacteria group bacterium]
MDVDLRERIKRAGGRAIENAEVEQALAAAPDQELVVLLGDLAGSYCVTVKRDDQAGLDELKEAKSTVERFVTSFLVPRDRLSEIPLGEVQFRG